MFNLDFGNHPATSSISKTLFIVGSFLCKGMNKKLNTNYLV